MKILGISAYYHDSAAAITSGGKIIAAAQEERFSRIKHDPSFPSGAIKFCLQQSGFTINELDAVVYYDKPWLKFERLLETYYNKAPLGLTSFISSVPVWIKEKLFMKKIIRDGLFQIEPFQKSKLNLLFTEHHLSHAASAYYPSPFHEAAIITLDGVGEWTTTSIGKASGNKIEMMKELKFPHSLGLLYSSFTYFLGFKVNSGEYKLMGLAPYGNKDSDPARDFIKVIKEKLVEIKDDGSIMLHMKYFRFETGSGMIDEKKWQTIFGMKRRLPETGITRVHCDLACAIQTVTNEIVLKIADTAKKLTGSDNLCMAGGVALNCVTNGIIQKSGLFKNIFIQPAAGDAGGALGAALAANYIYFNKPLEKQNFHLTDPMNGAYLGSEYSDKDIEFVSKKYKSPFEYFENYEGLIDKTARLLSAGNIIGWFQGRMEFGPRALGNRSILADARSPEMQKKLNTKIKFREGFRPFAPSVTEENVSDYFDLNTRSPYMLLVSGLKEDKKFKLPDNYHKLTVLEKLYVPRSEIPAVTHVDFSARIQTVSKATNPVFWQLLNKFKEITNCAVLVNTSFNVRGEPVVCTPEQAYTCFMRTDLDYLVMGKYLFEKKFQPEWKEKNNRKEKYKAD